MKPERIFWKNGKKVKANEAVVSVLDHGLLYGDGIFEGIRFYNNIPFKIEQHIQRLFDSAKAISLTLKFNMAEIKTAIEDMISLYTSDNGYIRIVVTRGDGALGLNPKNCNEPNTIIIIDELSLIPREKREAGITAMVTSTRRISGDCLDPKIKSLNYLNHIMAKIEANHAGVDEGILLNSRGFVTEACTENIFIAKDGIIKTPPIADGALDGITRKAVIELAVAEGFEVKEQSMTQYDLYTADECFLTGTAAEIIPVKTIDGRDITHTPGPICQKLLERFRLAVT